VTLYAGMGVSAGLAGADLLGAMLGRFADVPRALTEWERQLRPYLAYYQQMGVQMQAIFTPNRKQITVRRAMTRGMAIPVVSNVLKFMRAHNKSGRMKEIDFARA